MRAAVAGGDGKLEIRDVPDPDPPGPGEVRVRIRACGVCHSDVGVVQGYMMQVPPPVVPGHEPMGVVDAVGPGVTGVSRGRRVAVDPIVVCGTCRRCLAGEPNICERWTAATDGCGTIGRARQGGFAEYLVAPARNLVPVPDTLTDAAAAILVDACVTSYHAVRRAGVRAGETVLLLGLGGLGQASLRFLRLVTGLRILAADTSDHKLRLAEAAGADLVINAAHRDVAAVARAHTGGTGVDVVVEHSGNPAAVSTGLRALRSGGRAVIAGCSAKSFSVPMVRCCLDEISILGSHGFTHGEILEVVGLLEAKTVGFDDLVSHRLPLSELPRALQLLTDPGLAAAERPVRIVIDDLTC